MSRPIVRRITSAVLLLSILCFALPAAAAPAGRAQVSKASMVSGSSLLDQVFAWLNGLWSVQTPKPQRSQEKVGGFVDTEGLDSSSNPIESDRGAMIDPNGGH